MFTGARVSTHTFLFVITFLCFFFSTFSIKQPYVFATHTMPFVSKIQPCDLTPFFTEHEYPATIKTYIQCHGKHKLVYQIPIEAFRSGAHSIRNLKKEYAFYRTLYQFIIAGFETNLRHGSETVDEMEQESTDMFARIFPAYAPPAPRNQNQAQPVQNPAQPNQDNNEVVETEQAAANNDEPGQNNNQIAQAPLEQVHVVQENKRTKSFLIDVKNRYLINYDGENYYQRRFAPRLMLIIFRQTNSAHQHLQTTADARLKACLAN